MLPTWSLVSILAVQLSNAVVGYMIDSACGNDKQFVRERIDAAFTLIENTVTELNRATVDAGVDDLHNTLFGRRLATELKIKNRYDNMHALRTYTEDEDKSLTDVKFYCTTTRIEYKKGVDHLGRDETYYWNKDRKIRYKGSELSSIHANCFDIKDPTLMITFTFINAYSEIQICPWYLARVRDKSSKVLSLTDLQTLRNSVYKKVARVAIPVMAKLKYSPIDTFSLMDKTIVHELTHTDQAGHTTDQSPSPYGWKQCIERVQRYMANPRPEGNPLNNADSVSLFAVATWIITKGGGPVNPDGTFNPPTTTPGVPAATPTPES